MRFSLLALALLLPAAAGPALSAAPGKTVGRPTAPIRIELFTDFQCSACKILHERTLLPLVRDYVVNGKVYLVRHDFPLRGHVYAREAASYACASVRVGKYERVSDALFARQESWIVSGKVGDAACSVLTAAQAAKVRALVKDPAIAAEIDRDIAVARKANIRATPTMLVTHRGKQYPLTGAVDYTLLRRLLDDLLSR